MINKCKICGKEFEAQQRNWKCCSDECRKINQLSNDRQWYELNKDKSREYSRRYTNNHTKPTFCKICGKEVEAHYTATGKRARYQYHRDCLVNEAIAAIVRGEKFNKNDKNILMVASNKGFQKSDLLEIMAERGIKYGKQKPFAVWRR